MPIPTTTTRDNNVQNRVRAHRARKRASGLRPIQIWVPDTRTAAFRAAAQAQAQAVAHSPAAADDQAFIDTLAALPEA